MRCGVRRYARSTLCNLLFQCTLLVRASYDALAVVNVPKKGIPALRVVSVVSCSWSDFCGTESEKSWEHQQALDRILPCFHQSCKANLIAR